MNGERGFWFKGFKFDSGEVPDVRGKGRMVLQKDLAKETVASNYRPMTITCLPLIRKLLTGILAEKLYGHLQSNRLFPR